MPTALEVIFSPKQIQLEIEEKYQPTLEIKNFGLNQEDLLTVFQASEQVGLEPCSLNDIIIHLEATYCESIGIEYQYIRHPEKSRMDKKEYRT